MAAPVLHAQPYPAKPIRLIVPRTRVGDTLPRAMTEAARAPVIVYVPAVAGAGVPGYASGSRSAIVAPAGTPRSIP